MKVNSGFDGVEAWVKILSNNSDPERRARLRRIRDGIVESVRQNGRRWLREEIEAQEEALESLRERVREAEKEVSEAARKVSPSPEEGETVGGWSEETVANSRAAPLAEQLKKVRLAHRRARDRLAVMEAVEEKIAADGLPPNEEIGEEENLTPLEVVDEVFNGFERPEGAKTQMDSEVVEWISEAFTYLLRQGKGSEEAKNEILAVAARFEYHFTKRTLERNL